VALYRKFGFEVEGVLRRYSLRDGHWVDAYAMARLTDGPTPLAVDAEAVPGWRA
jgi:RimJ/RimL family protein N-acetyltransferase